VKRAVAVTLIGAVVALLASCAQPPLYQEVHADTVDAMQAVADELPEGTLVEDRSNAPYGCSLDGGGLFAPSSDGLFFTGHWEASPPEDFDGQAFIDRLPAALGDEWEADHGGVEVSFPAVALNTNGIVLDIWVVDVDGELVVDILAISRCGQPPTEE
jgi:hypothetical protein